MLNKFSLQFYFFVGTLQFIFQCFRFIFRSVLMENVVLDFVLQKCYIFCRILFFINPFQSSVLVDLSKPPAVLELHSFHGFCSYDVCIHLLLMSASLK